MSIFKRVCVFPYKNNTNNYELHQCRICFSSKDKLISPCKCSGSIKYVHKKCLKKWIKNKAENKDSCEICGEKYIIKKKKQPKTSIFTIFSRRKEKVKPI